MKSQKKYSVVIDTTGLRCPLPLLKVQKNIKSLRKNREALIITDDPMAQEMPGSAKASKLAMDRMARKNASTIDGYVISSVKPREHST